MPSRQPTQLAQANELRSHVTKSPKTCYVLTDDDGKYYRELDRDITISELLDKHRALPKRARRGLIHALNRDRQRKRAVGDDGVDSLLNHRCVKDHVNIVDVKDRVNIGDVVQKLPKEADGPKVGSVTDDLNRRLALLEKRVSSIIVTKSFQTVAVGSDSAGSAGDEPAKSEVGTQTDSYDANNPSSTVSSQLFASLLKVFVDRQFLKLPFIFQKTPIKEQNEHVCDDSDDDNVDNESTDKPHTDGPTISLTFKTNGKEIQSIFGLACNNRIVNETFGACEPSYAWLYFHIICAVFFVVCSVAFTHLYLNAVDYTSLDLFRKIAIVFSVFTAFSSYKILRFRSDDCFDYQVNPRYDWEVYYECPERKRVYVRLHEYSTHIGIHGQITRGDLYSTNTAIIDYPFFALELKGDIEGKASSVVDSRIATTDYNATKSKIINIDPTFPFEVLYMISRAVRNYNIAVALNINKSHVFEPIRSSFIDALRASPQYLSLRYALRLCVGESTRDHRGFCDSNFESCDPYSKPIPMGLGFSNCSYYKSCAHNMYAAITSRLAIPERVVDPSFYHLRLEDLFDHPLIDRLYTFEEMIDNKPHRRKTFLLETRDKMMHYISKRNWGRRAPGTENFIKREAGNLCNAEDGRPRIIQGISVAVLDAIGPQIYSLSKTIYSQHSPLDFGVISLAPGTTPEIRAYWFERAMEMDDYFFLDTDASSMDGSHFSFIAKHYHEWLKLTLETNNLLDSHMISYLETGLYCMGVGSGVYMECEGGLASGAVDTTLRNSMVMALVFVNGAVRAGCSIDEVRLMVGGDDLIAVLPNRVRDKINPELFIDSGFKLEVNIRDDPYEAEFFSGTFVPVDLITFNPHPEVAEHCYHVTHQHMHKVGRFFAKCFMPNGDDNFSSAATNYYTQHSSNPIGRAFADLCVDYYSGQRICSPTVINDRTIGVLFSRYGVDPCHFADVEQLRTLVKSGTLVTLDDYQQVIEKDFPSKARDMALHVGEILVEEMVNEAFGGPLVHFVETVISSNFYNLGMGLLFNLFPFYIRLAIHFVHNFIIASYGRRIPLRLTQIANSIAYSKTKPKDFNKLLKRFHNFSQFLSTMKKKTQKKIKRFLKGAVKGAGREALNVAELMLANAGPGGKIATAAIKGARAAHRKGKAKKQSAQNVLNTVPAALATTLSPQTNIRTMKVGNDVQTTIEYTTWFADVFGGTAAACINTTGAKQYMNAGTPGLSPQGAYNVGSARIRWLPWNPYFDPNTFVIAQQYRHYKVNRITFHYVPRCGTSNNGQITMAWMDDITTIRRVLGGANVLTSETPYAVNEVISALYTSNSVINTNVYTPCRLVCPTDTKQLYNVVPIATVNPYDSASDGDANIRDQWPGALLVSGYGQFVNVGEVYGSIWATYSVTLSSFVKTPISAVAGSPGLLSTASGPIILPPPSDKPKAELELLARLEKLEQLLEKFTFLQDNPQLASGSVTPGASTSSFRFRG